MEQSVGESEELQTNDPKLPRDRDTTFQLKTLKH